MFTGGTGPEWTEPARATWVARDLKDTACHAPCTRTCDRSTGSWSCRSRRRSQCCTGGSCQPSHCTPAADAEPPPSQCEGCQRGRRDQSMWNRSSDTRHCALGSALETKFAAHRRERKHRSNWYRSSFQKPMATRWTAIRKPPGAGKKSTLKNTRQRNERSMSAAHSRGTRRT